MLSKFFLLNNADSSTPSPTQNNRNDARAPTPPALLPMPPYRPGLFLRVLPDSPHGFVRSAVLLKMFHLYSRSHTAALYQFEAQFLNRDPHENSRLDMHCQAVMQNCQIAPRRPMNMYTPDEMMNIDLLHMPNDHDRLCIWIFDMAADNQSIYRQPSWCGIGHELDRAARRVPLCIVRQQIGTDDAPAYRFLPVRAPEYLFPGRKYCFSCLKPFPNVLQHNNACAFKCVRCQRFGPQFPCPAEQGVVLKCEYCFRCFRNRQCFKAHLDPTPSPRPGTRGAKTSVCARVRDCGLCGKSYQLRCGPHLGCLNRGNVCRHRLFPREVALADKEKARRFVESFGQASSSSSSASSSSCSSSAAR